MQYLTKLDGSANSPFYAIGGDFPSPVQRYICSTPETRDICNQPEIYGVEYTNRLCRAVTRALIDAPFRPHIENHPQHRVCVLNFLRGGLNFDLRLALHNAYGFNRHASAFMSSQRSRRQDGRWQVQEDMYRKLEIPPGAVILVGDVVATGITLENGLMVLLDHLRQIGSSVQWLFFFTIGCHKLEKILASFDPLFRDAFPDYQGSAALYFEGKFKLVDSKTELRIGLPGTDLIRRDALLSPEFETSQWQKVNYPLERCTIYDAGARAFHLPGYLHDVQEYWRQVLDLAGGGLTLEQALQERWPYDPHLSQQDFVDRKRQLWRNVSELFIQEQYLGHQNRWPDLSRTADIDTPEALAAICRERIDHLDLECQQQTGIGKHRHPAAENPCREPSS